MKSSWIKNKFKGFCGGIAITIMSIYPIIGGVYMIKFEREYHSEHGILTTYIGETVPLMKALIWPHYMYKTIKGHNENSKVNQVTSAQNEQSSAVNAIDSINAYISATVVFSDKSLNTRDASKQGLELLQSALEKINRVDSRLLLKIHPELPKRVDEEYRLILKENIEMLNSNFTSNRKLPSQRFVEIEKSWCQFLKNHGSEFKLP